ncbi:hypothetical protein [Massilia sp. TS11]|uniref:hypothetical protein n=1 Tax=Massilia sp. TS11 TaxID=2908003 RepID=UPI001EDC5FF1|nr:hypothetical protein [Massilia sp. TS11]MCG2585709.1 hypothetical protein [Massilia sp. TS11]
MLPALIQARPPRLVRAIRCFDLPAQDEDAAVLADELAGITAMVAERFTNDRTAEGIQRAYLLTVGCVSLGIERTLVEQDDASALEYLIGEGAEHAFQQGFRALKELAALPEDSLVGEFDQDPVYAQRRLKELFIDICAADPGENWDGPARYEMQLNQRKQVQAVVRAASWLRRHHWEGPIKDSDLNAEGVLALAIIFAVEGGGRIVARTGQQEFARFVGAVRKHKPDFEQGWAELLQVVPVQHHPVLVERIDNLRAHCTVLHKLNSRTALKTLFAELENYAGTELDADF